MREMKGVPNGRINKKANKILLIRKKQKLKNKNEENRYKKIRSTQMKGIKIKIKPVRIHTCTNKQRDGYQLQL